MFVNKKRGAQGLLLCAPLLLGALSSCAATVKETDLYPILPGVRMDPPPKGENSVFVEFRDLTGGGFEDEVFDVLQDAVSDRGWELSDDFYSADYVLYADLRLFGQAGTEEGDRHLAALGGIAAGGVTGGIVYEMTDNWWVSAGTGALTGSFIQKAIAWALQENSYQMVADLMLGRRIVGGVATSQKTGLDNQAGTLNRASTRAGTEEGESIATNSKGQELNSDRQHFELEQRLLAVASGRRMTKDMARDALLPKLVSGLKSQLPRVR